MKVLLIKVGKYLYYTKSVGMPIGLLSIVAYAREKRNGDEFKIIDMKVQNLTPKDVALITKEYQPDLIGLSTMTTDALLFHKTVEEIKRVYSSALILAGGPHPTSDPEDTLKDGFVDIAVIGEGEETFLEILNSYSKGENLYNIRGTAVKFNGTIRINPYRPFIENLDALPLPDWELIDFDLYSKHFGMAPWAGKRKYACIITSRGCPYRCTFCHNIFGKKFRARSPESVLQEITYLYEKGIRDFEIIDDIFNFDRARANKIMNSIISSGIKLNIDFPNGLRGDILDEETINKFRKAGTRSIAFAVETASPRMQKFIKKMNRLERLKKAIDLSEKAGIFNVGYFIFGLPTETEYEIKETINFAVQSKLHAAFFFILNPFKGTEIYKQIEEIGIPIPSYDSYESYYFGHHNYSNVPIWKLRLLVRIGLIKFYLWRFRIFKSLIRIPTKRYLFSLLLVELYRLIPFKIYKSDEISYSKISNRQNDENSSFKSISN